MGELVGRFMSDFPSLNTVQACAIQAIFSALARGCSTTWSSGREPAFVTLASGEEIEGTQTPVDILAQDAAAFALA